MTKPFDPRFFEKSTLPLGAGEKEIRAKLDAGDAIVFPPGDEAGRTIQAEWIAAVATPRGHFEQPLRIANARIEGPLVVAGAVFERPVAFVRCWFDSGINAQRATFRHALIQRRCQVEGALSLHRIDAAYDVAFTDCDFRGAFYMIGARVAQFVNASGSRFRRMSCEGLHARSLMFSVTKTGKAFAPVHFLGEVTFKDARIGFGADFSSAVFDGNATFERLEVGGTVFVRPATLTPSSTPVPLDSRSPVEFRGNVNFMDAAAKAFIFRRVTVRGDANFRRLRCDEAWFEDTHFEGSVALGGANIGADLHWGRVRSTARIGMQRLTVGGALWLMNSEAASLDMRRSRIGVLAPFFHDSKPGDKPFNAPMNLRGATFERLDDDWRHFLKLIQPFSSDPYDSLERYLRSSGEEREANDVYFERRRREGQVQRARVVESLRKRRFGEASRDLRRVFVDAIEHHLAGYGVRSLRLFVATVTLLILGALVFMRDDALRPKQGSAHASDEEAIVYSAALAIPLVQLPPLDRWRPSDAPIRFAAYRTIRYETFAVVYRLLCFVLVPLTIAAITGLLHRRER